MIGAPISETRGRKAVYLSTLPISLLFTMGAGLAQNLETLLICRFLSGAFGSPTLAIGAGTIADVWILEEGGGLASVLVILAPFMGPALGMFSAKGTCLTTAANIPNSIHKLLTPPRVQVLLLVASQLCIAPGAG